MKDIQHIVTHADCPDGMASAIILHQAFPEATIQFVKHGTEAYKNLAVREKMLFCDITPPEDRVKEFIEAGAWVLDHHVGQKHIVEMFGPRGVYGDSDNGTSGAVLAYNFIGEKGEGWAEFALLAGIRDTWQKNHNHGWWERACEQAYALLAYTPEEWLSASFSSFYPMLSTGQVLYRQHKRKVEQVVRGAKKVTFDKGFKLAIYQGTEFSSDGAELLEGYDLIVAFSFVYQDGLEKVILSCRSRTGFDCAKFCRKYEGGGHKGAAGMTLLVDNVREPCVPGWQLNLRNGPYAAIEEMTEKWIREHSNEVATTKT